MDSIYYQKKPFNNNKSNNNDKEGGPGSWVVRESCSHNLIHKFLGPNSLSGRRPVVCWASSIIDANALIY